MTTTGVIDEHLFDTGHASPWCACANQCRCGAFLTWRSMQAVAIVCDARHALPVNGEGIGKTDEHVIMSSTVLYG